VARALEGEQVEAEAEAEKVVEAEAALEAVETRVFCRCWRCTEKVPVPWRQS